jgi:hypothetical protein
VIPSFGLRAHECIKPIMPSLDTAGCGTTMAPTSAGVDEMKISLPRLLRRPRGHHRGCDEEGSEQSDADGFVKKNESNICH